MKRAKRPATVEVKHASPTPGRAWWPWAAAVAALFLVFEAYTPALNGAFVLDDRFLAFDSPGAAELGFSGWVHSLRPLLMTSYWLNFQSSGVNPYGYHATNVLLHFLGS